MVISEILRKECIAAGAHFKSKAETLREIARIAKKCDVFDNIGENEIISALDKREKLGSTGFGKGIAIPHCRLKDISEFVLGIVTITDGVEFDSLDNKKVYLIAFIIGPDRETDEHIRILSIISRILNIPGAIEEIRSQSNPETIYESFLRYVSDHVDTKDRTEKQLCQVFIQNEHLFEEIISIFAAIDTQTIVIPDVKNTREYLTKLPLFSGFFSDSHLGFNRIIISVIDKSLINETLRSIEHITGSLDKRTDIMVMVQDTFYTAGSLEA